MGGGGKSRGDAPSRQGVEEKELILLTGEVGCGKTTLTRALMDTLGPEYNVINIINPRLTPAQFLRTVAMRMEIPVPSSQKADLLEMIFQKVYEDFEAGTFHVIIIDEAQRVPNLLLAIKEEVDRNKQPGRYLLTGSANVLTIRGF
jgi:type II secretory pathway predicted ATPase ExeA